MSRDEDMTGAAGAGDSGQADAGPAKVNPAGPTITQTLMDDVLDALRRAYGHELAVGYYPEDPQGYRLNHPRGALLLGFSSGRFGADRASDAVWVERELTLPITLVFRQLNGPAGVIACLDRVRETLTGFTPRHADRPLRPLAERFVGQQSGIWQYAQEWAVRTVQVQQQAQPAADAMRHLQFEEI